MLNKLLLTISTAVFLIGCGANAPTPAVQSKKSPPSWFVNPPSDNAQFLYGVGMDADRESAIKAALSDMISKLGVSIESTFENTQKVEYGYASKKTKNSVKSDISKITISNYSVVEADQLSYKSYAVLVKSSRKELANTLISEMKSIKDEIESELKSVKNSDAITRYNTIKKSSIKAKGLDNRILVLSQLKKDFDISSYREFIKQRDHAYKDIKSSLHFDVRADSNSLSFKKTIQDYLNKRGFKLSKNIDKNLIVIKLKTDTKVSKGDNLSVVVINLNIGVTNKSERIGGRSLTLKERYKKDMKRVLQKASVHFNETLQNRGINEAIGIHLDTQ